MKKYDVKPFVKWVGGKRQLIDKIKERMPKEYNSYFEPFVGGGALFIELQNNSTVINDVSSELTSTYKIIRDNPKKLMKLLDSHEAKHEDNPKEYYYSVREQDRQEDFKGLSNLVKSARMIYLNKSCFNGLYRVNKKGYFNVPWNHKQKIKTYDRDNILTLSEFLRNDVKILNKDFELAVKGAKKGDFIFFDPPYDLLKGDTFDSYTKDGFGVEGQVRLAKLAHELDKKGCYVMITNHNTDLINTLYSDFNIDVVSAKRMINSDASNRKGEETIIYNYVIGEKQMKRQFDEIMNSLRKSVANYTYYTDFDKVQRNVNKYRIELNILNSLIGSSNIEDDFKMILREYPKTLKVIPLLLAIRKTEVEIFDGEEVTYNFKSMNHSVELYVKFMRETGLFSLMEDNKIKCLFDYITGVEVGLDTNARKNRTGKAMESIVESFISDLGIEYHSELYKSQIKEMYNIDIDKYIISEENQDVANKRFDFVIRTENQLYIIETNFYSGGGSKLNETARSFKNIASDINNAPDITFIWITDGVGWKTAKRNLKETYDIMEHLYTLTDLENKVLFKVVK